MQSEQDWMSRADIDDEGGAAERYMYFMRPEPKEDMGPITEVDDPYLGAGAKVREMSIGMTRNASKENKKSVLAYLHPFPHIRVNSIKPLQGWYKSKVEPGNVRPRPCFTEAVLTEPYGGFCSVGCGFCYINSGNRGYRGSGLISVPLNYHLQVRKQLSTMHRAAAGYFSSFTDPFLPLEQYYHNTELAAKEFVDAGLPIFFLSRLPYPEWAIDMLTRNPHSYAQKSINTPDPKDWRVLSPGAQPLEDQIGEISVLKKRGVYVSIQVNPIIPGVVDNGQVLQLFTMLKQAGADHVIVKFVEANYSWAPSLVEKMKRKFGDRGEEFARLFTENQGGEKTIQEEYRLKAHKLYSAHARRLGLTYATCYEYRYERNPDGSIKSKTGVSIGREFTTSSQCHGHRVPVYARNSEQEQFFPLEECPPSGCLYCADENEGKPRCGDELAAGAYALKLADLKTPIGDGSRRLVGLPLIH